MIDRRHGGNFTAPDPYLWVSSIREGMLAQWHMPIDIWRGLTITACDRTFQPDEQLRHLVVTHITLADRCPSCQGAYASRPPSPTNLDDAIDSGYREVEDRIDRGELEPTPERLEMLERWHWRRGDIK